MTNNEYVKKYYDKRQKLGLCIRCGKPIDRDGKKCTECLKKENEYHRKNADFARKMHICTKCMKVKVYGDNKRCPECREKDRKRYVKFMEKKKKEKQTEEL